MDLAHRDNISIEYKLQEAMGPIHNMTFHIQLTLGTERYAASGAAKRKAEEKASGEAYAKTKYPKPSLKPNTCVIPKKSPINELQELVTDNGFTLSTTTDIDMGPPKTYVLECRVNEVNLITRFNSTNKKTAKLEAAKLMLIALAENHIIVDPARRYNESIHHAMHPVSRLNEIQLARHEPEPAYYLMDRIPVAKPGGNYINFIVQISTDKYSSVGNGPTVKEARKEAARKLLDMMNFTIV